MKHEFQGAITLKGWEPLSCIYKFQQTLLNSSNYVKTIPLLKYLLEVPWSYEI